jgi:hypothetical protein
MKRSHARPKGGGGFALAITVVLFALVLVVLASGTLNLAGGADAEGVEATRRAIERAAVLCYATEGFYPPGLSYIESQYGVQIDRTRYSVRYEAFAPNITPIIVVAAK